MWLPHEWTWKSNTFIFSRQFELMIWLQLLMATIRLSSSLSWTLARYIIIIIISFSSSCLLFHTISFLSSFSYLIAYLNITLMWFSFPDFLVCHDALTEGERAWSGCYRFSTACCPMGPFGGDCWMYFAFLSLVRNIRRNLFIVIWSVECCDNFIPNLHVESKNTVWSWLLGFLVGKVGSQFGYVIGFRSWICFRWW